MDKGALKELNNTLTKVKQGFFVYYLDRSEPGDSDGHNLVVSRKLGEATKAFKENKKSKPIKGSFARAEDGPGLVFSPDDDSKGGKLIKGLGKLKARGVARLKGSRLAVEPAPDAQADDAQQEAPEAEQEAPEAEEEAPADAPDDAPPPIDLQEALAGWNAAKDSFNAGLQKVYKAVVKGLSADDADARRGAYQKAIKDAQMQDRKLDAALSALVSDPNDAAQIKQAIRQVEAQIASLRGDPLVVHLRANPFLPEFSQTLRAALKYLEKARAELSRALSAAPQAQ